MATILLLNGPNLDRLGEREPEIYGHDTLAHITDRLAAQVKSAGHRFDAFQSNAEHAMIEKIHAARGKVAGIVINPGAWGHTSLALADALAFAAVPYIEVHISNVFARGGRRSELVLAEGAAGVIVGCGTRGYDLAVAALLARVS